MANTNTIAALYNLPAQTVNATAETLLTNTVNGVTSTAILNMPANANVDSHSFRVRLIGKATGGTGATLTLKFYLGTALTGTNVAAFTVTGAAVPATGGNFSVYADLVWDSVSGTVTGFKGGQTNGTLTALAALNANGSNVASAAGLQFVASATFGAALATNSVTVEEFAFEQI
jgi:hypothetical protein